MQVEQVSRAVSAVASAGSFLPMPEHSPVEDEYLRTHPSGENRFECALLCGEGGRGWGRGVVYIFKHDSDSIATASLRLSQGAGAARTPAGVLCLPRQLGAAV
jgi:hypothetical protein